MNKTRTPLFHVSKRGALPWYRTWAIRGTALLLALVLCGIITSIVTGQDPLAVYAAIWSGSFGTKRKIWVLLQNISMLLCVSLAVTPAFRMRCWNLGGEGQALIGALTSAACMILLAGKLPNWAVIVCMTVSSIAAGAVYWGQLLDGVACFKTDFRAPVPAKSTIYSLLLPGLGQANNGDWWKIPIWTGGLVACGYFYHFNDMQYKRFRWITQVGGDTDASGYIGSITVNQAETYRDTYRRYRDYSILAAILVYALNVIDANVFAYMADFDVSDNIASLEVQPALIQPLNPQYTFYDTSSSPFASPALGVNLQFTF